jgi:2-polyprenyl-6-methoxyphenol hydroxylase-like FAD-dependent oxidoreductase
MARIGQHAVVIGGSLAGMCAARVLSDSYDRVTVYEKDDLPDGATSRNAVPQGKHLHLLMARGAQEYDDLFPGLLDDMVDAGVPILENRPDCIHFGAAGHVLGTKTTLREEFTAYVPSRPHLEWQIRKRASAIPNVEIIRQGVSAPRYDEATKRVTGVLVDPVDGGEPEFVAADIVIDSTGRGTRLPVWLEEWGFGRPTEDTVDVGITYATHRVSIPDGLLAEKVVVAGASREQRVGLGMLFYEDRLWVLTTFGTGKVPPPQTFAEMCSLADKMLPPHVADALRRGEPVGDVAFHKYPMSKWRRFDKLSSFPAGILPVGDSVVSFNPTFGQGMTMTALQAGHLRKALDAPEADRAKTLLRLTRKTTRPIWLMDSIGDLTLQGATGPKPWWYDRVGTLFDQFLGAAETEPVLAEWFLRRFSMLDSLWMVPPPSIVARTMRHNFRCWRAERKAERKGEPVPVG